MALFDFAGDSGGRTRLTLDPVLRAAALAVVMQGNQTEFGMMARIEDPGALRPRPGIRFGHAVREADGAILPPGGIQACGIGPIFTSLRIGLQPDHRRDVWAAMRALSATLDDLAADGCALEVKALRGVGPQASLAAMNARPQDLAAIPGLPAGADGTGVLLGAVDFGCAFAHPAFRLGDDGLGGTRLRLLWDQNGAAPPGQDLPGRIYTAAEIDAALAQPDPYAALGYVPWENGYEAPDAVHTPMSELVRQTRVHGTHVLSVAGGRRPAQGLWAGPAEPGVAPGAALAFVHLRPRALISEGDAVDVFEGVCALFAFARQQGMPAVVNLSIGANTGAHDGRGLMDRAFDAMLKAPGRAITVAAGNARTTGQHWTGSVAPGQPVTLGWRFAGGDRTPNVLRVYAPMQGRRPPLDIAVGRPGGALDSVLPPHALRRRDVDRLLDATGETIIGTAVSTTHPFSTEEVLQHFEIRLAPGGADETWQVTLSLDPGAEPAAVPFDAWIERDDLRGQDSSRFDPPDGTGAGEGCTLGSLACAAGPICVAAHDLPGGAAAPFSSCGPTRAGVEKPDVAAPGVNIRGAAGRGGQLDGGGTAFDVTWLMSGTSAAAPHVAGVVALMLQARPGLDAARIRAILRATARGRPGEAAAAWARDLGCGRVDAAAALAKTLEEPA